MTKNAKNAKIKYNNSNSNSNSNCKNKYLLI
jgi:hypothetical protein